MVLGGKCLAGYGVLVLLHAVSAVYTIPFWVFSLLVAFLTIYIGSHLAVAKRSDSKEEDLEEVERLTQKDAYLIPVIGSVAIFSIYICVKYLDKYYVNFVARLYFSLVGVFAISRSLELILEALLPEFSENVLRVPLTSFRYSHIPLVGSYFAASSDKDAKSPKTEQEKKHPKHQHDVVLITPEAILCVGLSAFAAVLYLTTNYWMLTNLYGICFAIQALVLVDVGSFLTAAFLLILLFFYDIFWVFGTEVMVTVATSFDVPIKLLFPRATTGHALLGLGDIVIPGFLVVLMARLDFTQNEKSSNSFYFATCLTAYVLALAFTFYINIIFEAPQPALLYLVPGCLISVVLLSLARGEFSLLSKFKTEENKEKAKMS